MKTTISLIGLTLLILSCSSEADSEAQESEISQNATENVSAPTSDKETEVTITFASGTLKGTHIFKPDPTNPMSQINVGFSDNVSNLNGSGLISADGKHRLAFGRPFVGEAQVGSQKAKKYTNECGLFVINPLDENSGYERIDGAYANCTVTNVTAVSSWEEGSVYNRRGVVANFHDKAEIEVRLQDGTTKMETVDIDVTVKARESRIK